jgi:hypothetical protein
LEQAAIESAAFHAEATGTIVLAPVLTNSSIHIPVSVSLSQPISGRLNVVPAGTPTNAPYAKLPDFFTVVGTVGNPKPDVNKAALIKLAAQSIGGSLHVGGTAGSIMQGLGLGGGKTASGTNAQASPSGNVLQGLGGLLGGATAPANTNNTPPGTNSAPAPAPQQPLNNLLNNFLKPKK